MSHPSDPENLEDASRPYDHVDGGEPAAQSPERIAQPRLGVVGWMRFLWRQLTSMRTALLLLLLLALAAVPGSLVPQRSSDPNGVSQYFAENPSLAPVLDGLQLFDVYTSVWFSAIYLLLFISLIGCVIPRTKHHIDALRAKPPRTPTRLSRLPAYSAREAEVSDPEVTIQHARRLLRRGGYRVTRYDDGAALSVSAERGYLRETGNLLFHVALLGILLAVGIGGGFGFTGQRVLVEGQSFVNTLASYDSFNPGRFFSDTSLQPYRLTLDELTARYEQHNLAALGHPLDFTARVGVQAPGDPVSTETIRVNEPLRTNGTDVYLLGNGYAPTITVRDLDGNVVFKDSVPFLPQDANLTSLGVVKVPDGLAQQVGMVGFFYPTQAVNSNGAFYSAFPDLTYPMLTLNVWGGDLGIDDGTPRSVYALDTDRMTQLSGGNTGVESIHVRPGESAALPNGLGSITLENASPTAPAGDYSHSVLRFVSLDIHHDPTQGFVLFFALLALAGLVTSLFVPRRRIWVKILPADGATRIECAGLARGDDPRLEDVVDQFARTISQGRAQ